MTVEGLGLKGWGIGGEGGGRREGVVDGISLVSVGEEGEGVREAVGAREVGWEVLSDALIVGVSGDVGGVGGEGGSEGKGKGGMGDDEGEGRGGGTAVKATGRRWGGGG